MKQDIAPQFGREFIWLFVTLIVASMFGVFLVVARFLWSWKVAHFYLVWNLILAWVPVGFALLAWKHRESRWRLLACSSAWLLFFPNAPYIMTDLVHLRERPPVPFWFDVVLLQSFIWMGLCLGFVSLYWMQCLVASFIGRRTSWIFVFGVIALAGFGIYLGRFQRWNSWDILVSPLDLIIDIFQHLRPPKRRMAGIYSVLYAGCVLIAYFAFYAITHLKFELITRIPIQDHEPRNHSPSSN